MIASFNSPFLLGALGAIAGLFAAALPGETIAPLVLIISGALAGVVAALVRERFQGARLARWARLSRDQRDAPGAEKAPASGYWGEVAYRISRSYVVYERELATERQRLESFLAAIDASPNGVVLLTSSLEISWCNRFAALHFMLDIERDRRQPVTNIVRDPDFVQYLRMGDFESPLLMRGPRGVGRLQVVVRPYSDGVLVLSQDVTERERNEQMQRDLIANASHELKTPLTVISGTIETLQSVRLDPASQQRMTATMAAQTSRMQAIIEDLLTLAEIEGKAAPSMEDWVGVAELVDESLHRAAAAFGSRMRLSVAGDDLWEVAGARTELQIALDNLVANACRHSPAGTSVQIAIGAQANGALRISVNDDGPGIAAEHLPRLAERFYRVDPGRSSEAGGTGLGLSIVRGAIQRHGGALEIGSVPGEGSSFTLVVPAARVRRRETYVEAAA
ncbi:MAG: ATP-binding protein [Betaproteobacteria bacterium]